MKKISTGNINRLEYRDGGGCLMLFGLPFFGMGTAFTIAAALGQMKTKGGGPAGMGAQLFGVGMGLLFAVIGAVIMFGRWGLIFDKSTQEAVAWWGLLFPMRLTRHRFADIREVTLSHEVRRNKNSTYSVYPVRLELKAGGKPIDIEAPTDELAARQRAEEVAEFLGLAIVDTSRGEEVRREAGRLQESLRDRYRRTGEEIVIGAPPPQMKSNITADGDTLRIEIPPPRFGDAVGSNLLGLGCGTVIVGGILGVVASTSRSFPWFLLAILPFIVLGLIGTLINGLRKSRTSTVITVDPHSLSVTAKMPASSGKTESKSSDEIEELRVSSEKGLQAVTDEGVLAFGEGLAVDELEFLRGLILRALTK